MTEAPPLATTIIVSYDRNKEYALIADPDPDEPTPQIRRVLPKPRRNGLCFCGSGKKFKHCHYRPQVVTIREGDDK